MFTRTSALVSSLLGLVACLFLSACANYQLGTDSKLEFKTIFIAPVQSEASIAQARALVGGQVREHFLRDPRVTLVGSPEEADAVLSITLKNYERDATVSQAKDTGLARKFAITLKASCDLKLRDGRVLFEKRIIDSKRDAYVDGGQLLSEHETLPRLAEGLAKSLCHAVLDTW